ncbi:PANX3 protein, partial [Turnix velox]|nr:PANX3 protein [Turnix velox]
MSLSQSMGELMLSDALLPDPHGSRSKRFLLELPTDRLLKLLSVGLPLFSVSLAFAREFSSGSQISCFPPSNFTPPQWSFTEASCWDSLLHHATTPQGLPLTKSLWALKVFPYSLLVVAMLMYLPHLLWARAAAPSLLLDLLFISEELDKSYNRSVRLVQHLNKVHQDNLDHQALWEDYEKARHHKCFEFPLLAAFLTSKQRSRSLLTIYLLKNILHLLFLVATCFYLLFLHLQVFPHDEFRCSIKVGLLQEEPNLPPFLPCKLGFSSIFHLLSWLVGGVYVLLLPLVAFNLLQLCCWDRRFLSIYQMLPPFNLLLLSSPFNDLNLLLLFLRANLPHLHSFPRLKALKVTKPTTNNPEDTLVDIMTLLAGLENPKKPKA